jgi:hypothetical protein
MLLASSVVAKQKDAPVPKVAPSVAAPFPSVAYVRGEQGERGRDGRDGKDGKDAPPADAWKNPATYSPFVLLLSVIIGAVSLWRTTKAQNAADTERTNQADRTQRLAQVNAFLQLRSAFSKIRADFTRDVFNDPALKLEQLPLEERNAMLKYWYNAFDEWYVTRQLFPNELGKLWDDYYRDAIKGTTRSEPMLCALAFAKSRSKVGVDDTFYKMVVELARAAQTETGDSVPGGQDGEEYQARLKQWVESEPASRAISEARRKAAEQSTKPGS